MLFAGSYDMYVCKMATTGNVNSLLREYAEKCKSEKFLPLVYRITGKEQPLDYYTCSYLAVKDPALLYQLRKLVPRATVSAMA